MDKLTIALLTFLTVAAFSGAYINSVTNQTRTQQLSSTIKRDLFEQWKLTFSKSYLSIEEEEQKFMNWLVAYEFVEEHNKIPENTYTVGLNQFADMSREEWKSYVLCLNKPKDKHTNIPFADVNVEDLATSVDWRTSGAVTAIKNQGSCGSCWSFSATGALECQYFVKNKVLRSFSEQQLIDCTTSYGNQGCNGGDMDPAFTYVASVGIETESSYPYAAVNGKCKYSASLSYKVNTGYHDIAASDNAGLLAAANIGTVSVGIDASSSAFQYYTSGVFNYASCGTSLDHGVMIVGYSTTASTPYWIVKNQWGTTWGMSGYIEMALQTTTGPGMCGIALGASYPN